MWSIEDNGGLVEHCTTLNGLWNGDEHPAYAPYGVWPSFTFLLYNGGGR